MQTAIYPGRPWLDTQGNRIQAHAGGLFYENGQWYWYGENKEKTDGKNGIWTWGIRAYHSADLYNWTDCGLIIPPVLDNPDSNLAPQKHIDRPHILKNPRTGQYVCWLKLSGKDACFALLTAPALLGPYTLVRENYRPLGMDGRATLISTRPRTAPPTCISTATTAVSTPPPSPKITSTSLALSPSSTPGCTRPLCGGHCGIPRGRQVLYAHKRHDRLHPQPQRCRRGRYPAGTLCAGGRPPSGRRYPRKFQQPDQSGSSAARQTGGVPDAGRPLGARLPRGRPSCRRADPAIAAHYEPDKYTVTPEEARELAGCPLLGTANTSVAGYVWLPLTVEDGKPCIRWRDAWTLEEL